MADPLTGMRGRFGWRPIAWLVLAFGLPLIALPSALRPAPPLQWEPAGVPAVPGAVRQLLSAGDAGAPVLYAVAEHWGIYRSEDSGASWDPASRLPRRGLGRVEVTCIALAPDDPWFLLAVLNDQDDSLPALYRTGDGGRCWVPRRGLSGLRVEALTMVPGRAAYAACGRHLYFSPDGGDTWLRLADHPAQGRPLVLSADAARGALYLGTEGDGLWLTTDQGASWSSALAGRTVWAVAVAPKGQVYAGTEDGLHLSEDGGASWQRVRSPALQGSVHAVAAGPSGEVAAAVQDRAVTLSMDGGTTWRSLPPLPIGGPAKVLLLQSGHLYAGTEQGVWRCRLPDRQPPIAHVRVTHGSGQR
ncbi:MAG: hypothetical protein K6V36_05695 [Anaerolineae bacterium]|nr:hypothetical protein [Anaerolineae bacterium]